MDDRETTGLASARPRPSRGHRGEATRWKGPTPEIETGLPDHVYDIVLLLQQAASDVVRYEHFAHDADDAGDADLAAWMRELADSDREVVARASRMLAVRLDGSAGTGLGTRRDPVIPTSASSSSRWTSTVVGDR